MPQNFEKYQILWIISYVGRDVMIVCMILALYYGFSMIDNKYRKIFYRCHTCCFIISSYFSRKKLIKKLIQESIELAQDKKLSEPNAGDLKISTQFKE